jgi:4-amino-4-deoxy-L-arabinose transferase-like glycosyltransferase
VELALALGYVRAVSAREHVKPSPQAWGAIAACGLFIALTCWWLTQDRSIPIYDAGEHLWAAFEYHDMLQAGNLLGPFEQTSIYPTLVLLVGAVSALIGGVNVASPILGENLLFVPLLALGCYQIGRLLFGRLAGMLAVVFLLGSPLLISLFHVFMLDAPLTALVAVSVWLILASEDFARPGVAALAGLAVGLGFNVKAQFAQLLIGLVVVVLAHGGWRNWRGFALFSAVALAVGSPWYLIHLSDLGHMLELGGANAEVSASSAPPTLSADNLTWYLASILDSVLYLPLFVLALAGTLWTLLAVVRSRGRQAMRLEFLAGGFAAWLVLTLTPHHDVRYGLPLLAFMAVIATGWIASLPRATGLAAGTLLALAVLANTLGITFGVGGEVSVALPVKLGELSQVTVYSTNGFLAGAPSRDGDVPGLLVALHREGVRTLAWSLAQSAAPDFSAEGLLALARIAQLTTDSAPGLEYVRSASVATLVHEPVTAHTPATCTRLSDGTGVWVVRYDAAAGKLAFYCPSHSPRFSDPGVVG